jgi:type IV pilus assembly protein PilC
VSGFVSSYWWALIAVPTVAFFALRWLAANNPAIRYRVDALKLTMPWIGPILKKIILSRFASVFSLMYASGITILDSMKAAEETAGNLVVQEALKSVSQQTVTQAFQEVALFPPLVVRMLRVGEATGALDTALTNVSYFYNREVREGIARVQVMIEPALTIVMGALLGWVMLSVLGPIYDVISKVKI